MRGGEIRVERDGRVVCLDRLQRLAEPVMRLAQQIVHARLRRADFDGALGQVDALLVVAFLARDHGDVIERVGIGRVAFQHLDIALHGHVELALAVVEQALLQQGFGFGGVRHRGF